jgi:3-dehydroquinate synthase
VSNWSDGFAEIIKHACILDARAFSMLEGEDIVSIRKNKELLSLIIKRNALLKTKVVQKDEFEKGDRKLLNYGHTLGHALETQYELSHGQAISLGMVYAARLSEQLLGFQGTQRVVSLLEQYGLPTEAAFKMDKVLAILRMDKKRVSKHMSYVLLEKIGKAVVHPIELKKLELLLKKLA